MCIYQRALFPDREVAPNSCELENNEVRKLNDHSTFDTVLESEWSLYLPARAAVENNGSFFHESAVGKHLYRKKEKND